MQQIPKVVSGFSEKCLKIGYHYYSKVFKKVIRCDNLKTAEFSKIDKKAYKIKKKNLYFKILYYRYKFI